MYRLLIIDDEEIITDSLYEVFCRFMPEQLDVCKAYSGKEALDWMRRTRIDIVLTDIAMPGMNGLELMEKIHTYWPRCRIIFLTGHSNFEYAYRAIQENGVRYLLKTEGYDKVTETVNDVMSELKRQTKDSSLLEKSREQLYAYEFMIQGNYIRHLLSDSKTVCIQNEIMVEFQKLNITLDATKNVYVVLGRLSIPEEKSYLEITEYLSSVRTIIDNHFTGNIRCISIVDKYGDILSLIQPEPDAEEILGQYILPYLEGTLEIIQEESLNTLGLKILFTVSGEGTAWQGVTRTYERLRQLLQQNIGDSIPMILRDSNNQDFENIRNERIDLTNRIEILSSHLETNRQEDFHKELEGIVSEVQDTNVFQMTETYFSIAIVIYSYINRIGWQNRIENIEKLLRLDDHISILEGFYYLKEIADKVFDVKQTDEQDRASLIVERICRYIEMNLREDLSLVKLAEIHYFNPSYLSYFFKQETGMNLSEYIEKCRIRKSKELLSQGELKIREISTAVGYNAAHSFTRFFKKVTGKTPKEYRDSLY
ncbi:response regulator transcription factor [Bacillus alkalicellulosilyticus]|uniref:response regulator transcription factor n=1 Tax=Alkalihalobacterium alkalicellulosilyticum TaxID=1912214 RepID=UPI000996C0B2|nr:response regulator [Bacillus alkalicellulosilyticus]